MLFRFLESKLQQAVAAVLPDANLGAVVIRPCPDPKFGDYQTSALMALARERKLNPRQLAADVVAKLDAAEWCDKVEVAGAGFVNFRLKDSALGRAVKDAVSGGPLFFEQTSRPQTVVIDFSSPNVAKPMHVGHIRSTILGDSLARTLRLLGHRVVTDNHIGDWGTQFGKLLVGWKRLLDRAALERDAIAEMERLYRTINSECEQNPATLEAARQELVKLQAGDAENLAIWREMQALSQVQFDTVYGRLGVKFDHVLGESFYNPWLREVVDDLVKRGIARESEGATAIFSDGKFSQKEDPFLIQRDGEWHPNPALVQKSDGGFNYATTDLATLDYRLRTWNPDRILYVTDARQQLHFRQIFCAFRRWHPDAKAELIHVWFGSIMGSDGRPFKTRTGDTVKLADLLDEAEERAFQTVTEKNPDLPEATRREIARIVGIGAVKYADLSPNRQSDYVFSWDKILALNGNTAPYLQYAYTRIRSIFRKAGADAGDTAATGELALTAPEETRLAKHLLNFGLTLEAVAEELRPNYLCNYLYELAGHFARFYEACPVLKASGPERAARLALCDATARVLKKGLDVLGIETTEQM
jgi:arginyl-tRNA synthetase